MAAQAIETSTDTVERGDLWEEWLAVIACMDSLTKWFAAFREFRSFFTWDDLYNDPDNHRVDDGFSEAVDERARGLIRAVRTWAKHRNGDWQEGE